MRVSTGRPANQLPQDREPHPDPVGGGASG
jgi:hypothetical protein